MYIVPDGRRAWSHPTPGPVVAAAWAPNPIVIAYVVRRGGANELHVIEGDGDRDQLVDADVAPVRPSWRADTQALAYVGRDGRRAGGLVTRRWRAAPPPRRPRASPPWPTRRRATAWGPPPPGPASP